MARAYNGKEFVCDVTSTNDLPDDVTRVKSEGFIFYPSTGSNRWASLDEHLAELGTTEAAKADEPPKSRRTKKLEITESETALPPEDL